ncbi:MAG: GumC family protein [Pseudomonadota bacterium]
MMHRGAGELHLQQVVTLLRRRRGLILTSMIGGAALAFAGAMLLPPRYTAKAQLLHETELRDGVEVVDETAVDTLVELLLSPNHLRRLAASLAEAPAQAGDAPAAAGAPPQTPDFEALEANLSVFKERRSRLIGVTYVSNDPALAAEVANRAVSLHLSGVAERQDAARAQTLEALAAALSDARETLVRSEEALRAHRVAYGATDKARRDEVSLQIAELNRELRISRSQLAEAEARRALAMSSEAGLPAGDGAEGNLLLSSADDAPAPAEPRAGTTRLAEEAAVFRARIDEIEARLATLRDASEAAGEAEVRLQELEREARAAGQVYESLLRRNAELAGSSPGRAPVRIVSRAEPPERPSSPSPALFIFPALLASGLISGLGAVALERMDQRLRSERDVQEALGAPCIGLVPRLRLRRRSPARDLLPEDPYNAYTEAIRAIVAAAAHLERRDSRPVVHLFTGSAEGAGSTTLAIGFAIYAARLRRRVLLMDLDFRRPRVMHVLRDAVEADAATAPEPSAPDYLVAPAPELGIDLMPAPRLAADPLEIISRQEFRDLMARLRETYDCIVIDSAPVATATETRLLSLSADEVILCVKWGVTEAAEAGEAMRRLRAARPGAEPPVSVAVTQVNMRVHTRRRYGSPAKAPETEAEFVA